MVQYYRNKIKIKTDFAELLIFDSYTGKIKATSLIDIEDVEYVKKYRWCVRSKGYVGRVENKKLILLHRKLLNCEDKVIVDHINKSRLDNRKSNLRMCSHQNSLFNSSIKSNNNSGVTGVGWDAKCKKWRARISINRKLASLGFFENKNDAIIARLTAEKKYYGEFSPQYQLFKLYRID